jgi:hypothetical protein
MRECTLQGRDMYADLERIEERGKRKKDTKKKPFSIFGKKDEEAPIAEPSHSLEETAAPAEPETEPLPEERTETPEMMEISESSEPELAKEYQPTTEQGNTPRESEMVELVESKTEEDTETNADQPTEPVESEDPVEMDIVSVEPEAPPQDTVTEITPEEKPEQAEPIDKPEAAHGQSLQDSPFYKRDIYAAFDKIEQRGKSLKEQRSGIFVKPQEPKEETAPQREVIKDSPAPEPVEQPLEKAPETEWSPLTGRKLRKAEEEMHQYKRKLDKIFKSGLLTKDECLTLVRKKEEDLGLKPPTWSS